ncbi:tRNA (guanosine(46)-N7)-methyltransferase TrmB [Achromobacter xylosoxidans]|uniref:tRNA (guanine-N(7)-)-methyltransferase n=2 Tax=Alcaligenaceae TaxID=506 RepID=A0A424WJP7_ALCXX|nr:tRNA (guanosine(46)-N7)-methyltransferase TrmB [Achromobacter xylosoxidans]
MCPQFSASGRQRRAGPATTIRAMNTNTPENNPAAASAPAAASTPATPGGEPSATAVSPETQAALASTAHAPNSPGATHIRSFVHRRGHITQGQLAALERLMGQWSIPYAPRRLDPAAAFGRQAPTVLEIGFGMGETTEKIALARPGDNFLGVEVFNAGVGSLLRRIEDSSIPNLRIIQHDAVEVVRDMIAPDSLAGVHIYFPDPWPKKRHHKRRLIQPAFISLLASRIAPGGYIHCATDWEDYAVQMLEVLGNEPQLANTADGYAPRPDYRPLTKFENRGLRLGHGVWDLIFKRVA